MVEFREPAIDGCPRTHREEAWQRGNDERGTRVSDHEGLFDGLAQAVTAMKPERVAELARQVLAQGLSAEEAITTGLAAGMRQMGERFAAKQCFVPEVLLAARAMYAGFDILKEHMAGPGPARGRVILGVVQGDIHDIGKNIVKVMAQAAGFDVLDLGRTVPLVDFMRAAESGLAERPDGVVLGLSALMTTTMTRMGKVVELLDGAGLRPGVKVVVGGAPVTERFARSIGADGWAPDAHSAVAEFERLSGGMSRTGILSHLSAAGSGG
ncbi:cobalamin-binding protein [candidate division WOR-3 bacterium]|nr:cobalamin-binding protein [candidate division WOR-3 bacterium]